MDSPTLAEGRPVLETVGEVRGFSKGITRVERDLPPILKALQLLLTAPGVKVVQAEEIKGEGEAQGSERKRAKRQNNMDEEMVWIWTH